MITSKVIIDGVSYNMEDTTAREQIREENSRATLKETELSDRIDELDTELNTTQETLTNLVGVGTNSIQGMINSSVNSAKNELNTKISALSKKVDSSALTKFSGILTYTVTVIQGIPASEEGLGIYWYEPDGTFIANHSGVYYSDWEIGKSLYFTSDGKVQTDKIYTCNNKLYYFVSDKGVYTLTQVPTKADIDTAISNATKNFVTQGQVSSLIAASNSNYPSKTEMNTAISNATSSLATKAELNQRPTVEQMNIAIEEAVSNAILDLTTTQIWIDGQSVRVLNGSSWEDFVESDSNTVGWVIDEEEGLIVQASSISTLASPTDTTTNNPSASPEPGEFKTYDWVLGRLNLPVKTSDTIIPGEQYVAYPGLHSFILYSKTYTDVPFYITWRTWVENPANAWDTNGIYTPWAIDGPTNSVYCTDSAGNLAYITHYVNGVKKNVTPDDIIPYWGNGLSVEIG